MSSALEAARAAVAGVLDGMTVELANGPTTLKALDYLSENVTAPAFAVLPGSPYIATSGDGLGFGCKRITWAVVVLVNREAAKTTAGSLDLLLLAAIDALEEADYDVSTASQPGTVTYSGLKFYGSVITIQHDLKL